MKRIILALTLLFSINSAFAISSTPEIDKKYDAQNFGIKDERIDTKLYDICHRNTLINMMAAVNPAFIESSVMLNDTQFKQKYEEIKGININEINNKKETNMSIYQLLYNYAMSVIIFAFAGIVFVITMKNFGVVGFDEYNLFVELLTKGLGILLLIPTASGNVGIYLTGEFIVFVEKFNGPVLRENIDKEHSVILQSERVADKDVKLLFNYEASVAPIDVAFYAYSSIKQTDKFHNQFTEDYSKELDYGMNEAIKINNDSIVFGRTLQFINRYNGGSIPLLPVKGFKNIQYNEYITDNPEEFKNAVKQVQDDLRKKSKENKLSVDDTNDVMEVLKLSYNKALVKTMTEIWNNDIEVLHQKNLENQCFIQGLGTYSKSYVKKLNGTLPSGEDEGSIFCVEKINGEYVALGADAKLQDSNNSSKESFDLTKNNKEFIIKRKRELAETKIFPIDLAFYEAYKTISKSSTELQMLKEFACNPVLYSPHTLISFQKLSYKNDYAIRDFLKNGLQATRNNANTNLILESAMNSHVRMTEIIRNLPNLKLRSSILEVIKENRNIQRIGIDTKPKSNEQIFEDGDTEAFKSNFFKNSKDIYSSFINDAGLKYACLSNNACVSSVQNNFLGTVTGFGENLKSFSWRVLVYGTGYIAAKQTAGYFKAKSDAKKGATGQIKEVKNSKLMSAAKKVLSIVNFLASTLTLLAVPLYFFGFFLSTVLTLMISMPLFVMTISYYTMLISLFVLGVPLFVMFKLLNVNDKNNFADITRKIFVFPLVILFVPTLIYILSIWFKVIIFYLSYYILTAMVIPLASSSIEGFFVALFIIVYLFMFVITTSIALTLNIINVAYEMFGFDKIFTLNITQYAEEVNAIFLKIIPGAKALANLIYSTSFNKKRR